MCFKIDYPLLIITRITFMKDFDVAVVDILYIASFNYLDAFKVSIYSNKTVR